MDWDWGVRNREGIGRWLVREGWIGVICQLPQSPLPSQVKRDPGETVDQTPEDTSPLDHLEYPHRGKGEEGVGVKAKHLRSCRLTI